MKIAIKKKEIASTIEFLYDIKLKGKESRHRSRFVKLLKDRLNDLAQDEKNLLIEFTGQDKDGEPLRDEKGEYALEDIKGFREEQNTLLNELIVFEGEDYQDMLKTVKNIVLEYDGELSGQAAEFHNFLCELFENADKGDNK